jgi:thiol-disulfide isomerase/thioredoxin
LQSTTPAARKRTPLRFSRSALYASQEYDGAPQKDHLMDFAAAFDNGLTYSDFLSTHGTADHQQRWATVHEQINLSDAQREVLAGFVREMKVIVVAGAWCGDCVNQCPIFDHLASAANGKIDLRFFDRDQHMELADALSTCGAQRVPSALFLSEDNFVCGRYGDRTLAKYRDMAATQLGAACPSGIGGADQSLLDRVTQEWLDEFERIQLMLRLSGRLRKLHND